MCQSDQTPNDAESPAPCADEAIDTHRYRIVVAYDGSQFHGWQKQEPPDNPPLRTVQGVLNMALMKLLRQPVNLVGASRTDAGVHALGQVAQFDAATSIPLERLQHAITSRLPTDIEVRHVEIAPPYFQAIGDAVSKQYRYRFHNIQERPLTLRHTVYHCDYPLNVEAMNDAAGRLIGEHDFAGFSAASHGRQTTVRTIHDCHVLRDGQQVHVVVAGSGFLYNMVRIIAGTLLDAGRGRCQPTRIDEILATADRRLAGPTLPPEGLCLEWIRYQ
jgi:tRNA pseudouridine38-40 synthase